MPTEQKQPLILTLRLDAESQAFFDYEREKHFPPERNLLKAHLTLFHQLPNNVLTRQLIANLKLPCFNIDVTGLISLGAGVAYRLNSVALTALHKSLNASFADTLIPQDRQPFRPHITIHNKVTHQQARSLLTEKTAIFRPFQVKAIGLDLWAYLGGPWEHEIFCAFNL